MIQQWPPSIDFETYDRKSHVVRYTQCTLRGVRTSGGITRWDLERLVERAAKADVELGRSLLQAVQAGLDEEE